MVLENSSLQTRVLVGIAGAKALLVTALFVELDGTSLAVLPIQLVIFSGEWKGVP